MKTKLFIVASALLLAGPAVAQEPLEKSGTEPPTTQNAPAAPSTAPEPMEKMGTEPSHTMTPPADKQAEAPSPTGALIIGELRESKDDAKTVAPLNATVDKVEDMDVYDANGKKIAEVDSVLEDKNGEIKGVAIEYGGFLGIGEKGAILTLDQVQQKDGNLVTEITEDQLGTLPAWND